MTSEPQDSDHQVLGAWHSVDAADPNVVCWGGNPNDTAHFDLFSFVHSKKHAEKGKGYVAEHGLDVPLRLSHLFKRPIVRQWIHDDYIYREKDDHIPSRMELFFDLMFAGIAHLLAESALEDAPAYNVLKFVLSYFPAFSVWNEVRMFLNMSGTDDALERLGLLFMMLLLSGYSANAAAVHIFSRDSDEGLSHGSEGLGDVGKFIDENYYFTEGYASAFRAAVGFYLVSRLVRVSLCLYYAFMLPSFRISMLVHGIVRICVSVLYVPIVATQDGETLVALLFTAMALDILTPYIAMFVLRVINKLWKHRGRRMFIPAISHAHAMERFLQFTVVLVGEMIISSTYSGADGNQGLSNKYARASLCIVTAFMLTWLYFDVDSSRTFQHALRRHALPSMLFSTMHFPLTGCIILASAAMKALIKSKELTENLHWFVCGSIGVTLFCIGIIGVLHRGLDKDKSGLVPRWVRLLWRFGATALILCLPLMNGTKWLPRDLIGVIASILAFTVIFETLSKLGTVGRKFDEHKAELVYRSKVNHSVHNNPDLLEAAIDARIQLRDLNALHTDRDADAEKLRDPKAWRLNARPRLARGIDWHPYGGLTHDERGEEDVGMESELGHLEAKALSQGQRWAHAA